MQSQPAVALVVFCISASCLMVVNKLCLQYLPLPSLLCVVQLAVSALGALAARCMGARVDMFEAAKVRAFLLFVTVFTCTLFASMQALRAVSVEMVLVVRACCPLAVSTMERLFLDMPAAPLRARLAAWCVLASAVAYMHVQLGNGQSLGAASYGWLSVYFCFDVAGVFYGKHLAHTELSTWGRVLYVNTLSLPPMLGISLISDELNAVAPALQHVSAGGAHASATVASLVSVSCMLGVLITFSSWEVRRAFHASSFAMVSLGNKLITIIIGAAVFADPVSPVGVALVLVCMGCCAWYVHLTSDNGMSADGGSKPLCAVHLPPWVSSLVALAVVVGLPALLGMASMISVEPVGMRAGISAAAPQRMSHGLAAAAAAAATNKQVVVVTGGTGLVGTAIQRAVAREPTRFSAYHFVYAGSRHADLTSASATTAFLAAVRPAAVLHLAANVGGLYKNLRDPISALTDNMAMGMNVLGAANALDVRVVVSVLSTCVFPERLPLPMNESGLHAGAANTAHEGYAVAKRGVEVLSRLYTASNPSRHYSCVIPTNIYGPHDNFDLEAGHVLPSLVHKCRAARERGEPFMVRGSGAALRQFIFAEDLATVILLMFEDLMTRAYTSPAVADETDAHASGAEAARTRRAHTSASAAAPHKRPAYSASLGPVIAAPDEADEVSIAGLARLVARTMDCGEPRFDTSYPDGVLRKTVSNAKLRSLWPELRFVPLSVGVAQTVAWFEAALGNTSQSSSVRLGDRVTGGGRGHRREDAPRRARSQAPHEAATMRAQRTSNIDSSRARPSKEMARLQRSQHSKSHFRNF